MQYNLVRHDILTPNNINQKIHSCVETHAFIFCGGGKANDPTPSGVMSYALNLYRKLTLDRRLSPELNLQKFLSSLPLCMVI